MVTCKYYQKPHGFIKEFEIGPFEERIEKKAKLVDIIFSEREFISFTNKEFHITDKTTDNYKSVIFRDSNVKEGETMLCIAIDEMVSDDRIKG